ncbi:MAG TPA: OmpA family protein [Myxococcales bacterium]|nr:OmpA family protein [Myxococcales bacterium]
MTRASRSRSRKQWLAFLLTLLACPFAAGAVDSELKFEPGAAISLGNPQAGRFNPGGAAPLGGPIVEAPVVMELKETIPFSWSSSAIDPSALPRLDALVQALQDKKDYRVDIEGHASSEGIHHENHELSTSRAEAVREYLVNKGVARGRIFVQGYSSHRPVRANDTEAGRSANRRADVFVHLWSFTAGAQ